jgi:hypothetical protein
MTELAVTASFLVNSTNAIVVDAKFITSVLAGAIGTAAAVLRNLSELSEDRSKRATEKVETARVAALLDLLVKLPAGDSFSSCRKELELQLAHSISKLDAVRAKMVKLAQTPTRDLTFLRRLFVLFPPGSRLAWIIQGLAYLFMMGGPLVVLLLVFFRIGDAGTVGDVVVLIVFGSLAFRTWALAERKWILQSEKSGGQPVEVEAAPLTTLFVRRKPIGWKMLAAQICMWTCLFCAVESLEDIFLAGLDANNAAIHADQAEAVLEKAITADPASQAAEAALRKAQAEAKEARADAKSGLLLFLASLLGAGICRAWASSEWRQGLTSPNIAFARTIFPVSKPARPRFWFLAAGYLAAIILLIVSVVSWSRIFADPIDRIEFSFIWMAACAAFNRLLNCCVRSAGHQPMETAAFSRASIA